MVPHHDEPAVAMLGRELSEATSELNLGRGESMVLESKQEVTVMEAQQELVCEESHDGSSKPSENVLPRTIAPAGSNASNIVTGNVNNHM